MARACRWRQIYDRIREDVLSGRLAAGDRVPSSRQLSRELGAARSTVQAAYQQLLAEGYLEGRRGSGTFVAAQLSAPSPSPPPPAAPRLSAWGQRIAALSYPYRDLKLASYPLLPGVPDLDLFPHATWRRLLSRAAERADGKHLAYVPPEGTEGLREALCAYVARARGVRCDPDQIVVVGGFTQALGILIRALVDPGETAVVEDPHHLSTRLALAAEGAHIVPVAVDSEGLRTADLPPSARAAFVTPAHQYPTGATMSLSRRQALIAWARAAGAVVVEDDYDGEFRYGGWPVDALHALAPEIVVFAGTFSKSMFPALRLGFLVCPPALSAPLRNARWLADWGSPVIVQDALEAFLREGHLERHVRRAKARYAARREALVDALSDALGGDAVVTGARAGLHFALDLPVPPGPLIAAARARGVGLAPMAPHSLGPPRPGYVVGYGLVERSDAPEIAARIAAAVSEVRPRFSSRAGCSDRGEPS